MLKNIIDLKKFNNLKESGLSLLSVFIQSFLNCTVRLQQLPIDDFEKHFTVDIHTNIYRNCYRIDENKMALIMKVFGEERNSIVAVMPIILEGENISNIENSLFEDLIILLSKKITDCYNNSFHGGTKIFGEDLSREYISVVLAAKQYDATRIFFLIELFEKLAATTFEGQYFTTGLILTRSLFEYNAKTIRIEVVSYGK